MDKRKKLALIGTALVVLVICGVVWQVVEVNQSGRSPLAVLFEPETESGNAEPEATPVTMILREDVSPPTPSPTPSPTPTPTPVPTEAPKPEKTGSTSGAPATAAPQNPVHTNPPQTTAQPMTEPTTAPRPKATPTPRPQVVESTPEPTPPPEVQDISLDACSVNILVGDSWRINIASAPSSLYNQGATWVSSNSSVVRLSGSDTSGVTITGVSAGTTSVTVYSRTGQSASCTVTVS